MFTTVWFTKHFESLPYLMATDISNARKKKIILNSIVKGQILLNVEHSL